MNNPPRAVRFLGYPICTLPANLQNVGPSIAGTYLGHEEVAIDIAARVALLKNAVKAAAKHLPPAHADKVPTINLFVAPEFYFHGPQGPYLYEKQKQDPVEAILAALKHAFPPSEFPNWVFVCGSVLSAQAIDLQRIWARAAARNSIVTAMALQSLAANPPMQDLLHSALASFIGSNQTNPVLIARDRAVVHSNLPLRLPASEKKGHRSHHIVTEKYFVSQEDLVLFDPGGRKDVVTEQMIRYPYIDLSAGDLKKHAEDPYSIFGIESAAQSRPIFLGIEICLDHYDQRLRSNLGYQPFRREHDQLQLQVIPSCGVQIYPAAVAVGCGGYVFNCDGEYPLGSGGKGGHRGTFNQVSCIYADLQTTNIDYGGHTQLAKVDTAATETRSATFADLDPDLITTVPVKGIAGIEHYFAAGPGEVHIYGARQPFELFPGTVDDSPKKPKVAATEKRRPGAAGNDRSRLRRSKDQDKDDRG